jgi:hypothetical protein
VKKLEFLMVNPALPIYYPLGFKKLIISFTLMGFLKDEVSTQNKTGNSLSRWEAKEIQHKREK